MKNLIKEIKFEILAVLIFLYSTIHRKEEENKL